MSIRIAKAAFAKGLGAAGQVTNCTMRYAKIEGRDVERYFIDYRKSGHTHQIEVDVRYPQLYDDVLLQAGATAAQGE